MVRHDVDFHAPSGEEPLEQAFARARASFAAGTGVEHRVVTLWLKTWGDPDYRPFKEWLAAWDG